MEERVLLEELCEVRKSVEELRLQYSNIKDMLELLQREMFGMSKYFRNIEADYEWLKDYKENTTMKRLNMILDRFPKTPDHHETGKGTDPAGLEWRRVFHDSESFRNRRHSHCGHDPDLCSGV